MINQKSFELYMRDIEKYDLLTPQQEVELTRAYKRGDYEAGEKLVNSNLRFVVSIAMKYRHLALLEDLIHVGNVGLMNAPNTYDETRGFRFVSYACWSIKKSIFKYLSNFSRTVRIPPQIISNALIVRKHVETYCHENLVNQPPSDFVEEFGTPKNKVILANIALNNAFCISIDKPLNPHEEKSFTPKHYLVDHSNPETDKELSEYSLKKDLFELLEEKLTPIERDIIKSYFGIGFENGKTLEQIAVNYDLTRERIRQIKKQAINKLKRTNNIELLRQYL